MKRRIFIAAAGTVGIASAVSGASVVSSAYSSISTSVLLEDFTPKTKTVLDKFMTNLTSNVETLGLEGKFVKQIAMPVQIISNKTVGNKHSIVYKNKSGEYISLTVKNGVERIEVLKSI